MNCDGYGNVLNKALEIFLETKIDVRGVLIFESLPKWIQELHDA